MVRKHQPGWGCIYSSVNKKNHKEYVGKDESGDPVKFRWRHHANEARTAKPKCYFHRAIKASGGPDKFTWTVIWRGPVEQLCAKEIYFIRKRHTFRDDPLGGGYNLTTGGDGGSWSESSKKKLSATNKIRCGAPEEREKTRERQRIRWTKPEEHAKASAAHKAQFAKLGAREKLRATQLRLCAEPAERARRSAMQRKIYADPAMREKLRQAHLKRYKDPAERAKQSAGLRKRYEDPAEREKSRQAQLRRYADPAVKKQQSDALRKRYEDPAERKKTSDAAKLYWARRKAEIK